MGHTYLSTSSWIAPVEIHGFSSAAIRNLHAPAFDRRLRRILVRAFARFGTLCVAILVCFLPLSGASIELAFASDYSITDLGPITGVPTPYGGLTFQSDDLNTLIIGGAANTASGQLYSVGVTRDSSGTVTGFSGSASLFAAGAYNDGGVVYGPDDVLFLARWPVNELGQTKAGSTTTDKIVDMAAPGVTASGSGGLSFVPTGFPGAGQLKLVSWPSGDWYTIGIAPDGSGTFDVTGAALETSIVGGPEGIFYVPLGSPGFPNPSILVSEYSAGLVTAYEIDSNGDPIPSTRQIFISGLSGAEGAAIDPVTGDFFFSTFGTGTDRVFRVSGFAQPPDAPEPPTAVPEPRSLSLLVGGLIVLWSVRRNFKTLG